MTSLIAWFRDLLRPLLLQEQPPEGVEQIDADAEKLERLAADVGEVSPVCFLGQAGVGKSTLINALIAGKDLVLPSGGVGPLTAQELSVTYSEHRAFTVGYHAPQKLNRLIFAIESQLARQERAGEDKEVGEDLELDSEDRADAALDLGDADEPQDSAPSKIAALRKQASLLVTGDQNSERDAKYLCDRLREACGAKNRWGTSVQDEDRANIKEIQVALAHGRRATPRRFEDVDNATFGDALRMHAAGCLAPIINSITVHWNAPVLQERLALIDLPGLGVAADVHAAVTAAYIRERAKGVILVVNRSGIMESEAHLLRNSGFLNRLLHASGDLGLAVDPVVLMVAVVQLDVVAQTRWEEDRNRNGKAIKKRAEHFLDVCAEMRGVVRGQLRKQLEFVWSDGNALSQEKRLVVDAIVEQVAVLPVCAPEYRKALADDDEDRAFLDVDQTGIPAMLEALSALGQSRAAEKSRRLKEEEQLFFDGLSAQLNLIEAHWNEEHRAAEAVAKLRASIQSSRLEWREELQNRLGAYREFLRGTVPAIVQEVVKDAQAKATRDIGQYLRGLQFVHWKTLQAAVRREGVFYGSRDINLPRDFALRFEEPIAEAWGEALLLRVRRMTTSYLEDVSRIFDSVASWARAHGEDINVKAVDAVVEVIKSDVKRASNVGQETASTLREMVKNELALRIEGPVRDHCKQFVNKRLHEGTGTKDRMLVLFDQLGRESVEIAARTVKALLDDGCRKLVGELSRLKAVKQPLDELDRVIHQIVPEHEARISEEKSKRRASVNAMIALIRSRCPIQGDSN